MKEGKKASWAEGLLRQDDTAIAPIYNPAGRDAGDTASPPTVALHTQRHLSTHSYHACLTHLPYIHYLYRAPLPLTWTLGQ